MILPINNSHYIQQPHWQNGLKSLNLSRWGSSWRFNFVLYIANILLLAFIIVRQTTICIYKHQWAVKIIKMKYIIQLFAISPLLLLACNGKKSQEMSMPDNEKLVTQYFAYFNKHDWVSMANMYADTAEFKDPSLGPGIIKQTRQQIIDTYTGLHKKFPDVQDKIINVFPAGNKHIIVEFVSTGTAPDNSKFELPVCTIFTLENGKIIKDFTYYDNFEGGE